MIKPIFWTRMVMALFEAQIFAWSLFSGSFLFIVIFGFLLIRNIMGAYQTEKIAKENGWI
ncbi:MAG: DUF3272 family protein [Streptococcaceae bacterium]|nr:DUF3272 family protein [Streptococcaceae bacterium]